METEVMCSNLTPAQQRFADEYIISLNASRSYLKVFPGTKSPDSGASKMMAKPKVKAYIKRKLTSINQELDLKAIHVIAELTKNCFF